MRQSREEIFVYWQPNQIKGLRRIEPPILVIKYIADGSDRDGDLPERFFGLENTITAHGRGE